MKHEQIIYGSVPSKVSNSLIIESYERTGNVWKTAKEVGLCGQTVHERLTRLGMINKINYWTEKDDVILLENYAKFKAENMLSELAKSLGRTKSFICKKAKKLGLTDKNRKNVSDKVREKLSISTKKWISEKGHPKGYLGHEHDAETREKLSQKCKAAWANPTSVFNSDEFRQQRSDILHRKKISGKYQVYSRTGTHSVEIGGKNYIFKSSWEVEIARNLQRLYEESAISEWNYENKHFVFEDVKRGIRSFCPDFEVIKRNGDKLYIEVKGWKMPSAMKRIKMFRERYYDVEFYLLDEKEYGKILSESDYLRRRCI